eukprot:1047341-Rhodomonas_salina.1
MLPFASFSGAARTLRTLLLRFGRGTQDLRAAALVAPRFCLSHWAFETVSVSSQMNPMGRRYVAVKTSRADETQEEGKASSEGGRGQGEGGRWSETAWSVSGGGEAERAGLKGRGLGAGWCSDEALGGEGFERTKAGE